MTKMETQINEMHGIVLEIRKDNTVMKHTVFGTENDFGLKRKVEDIEKVQISCQAKNKSYGNAVAWVMSGVAVVIAVVSAIASWFKDS